MKTQKKKKHTHTIKQVDKMTAKHKITHIKAKERIIETDKTNIAQNTGLQDCLKSSLELVERLSKLCPCKNSKEKPPKTSKHDT